LSAILFLYRDVLEQDLPWLDNVIRSKRPARLPVVLTREEVGAVLQRMSGVARLMAILLYGAGLRLLECARLRVKDVVDVATTQIYTHVLTLATSFHRPRVRCLEARVYRRVR